MGGVAHKLIYMLKPFDFINVGQHPLSFFLNFINVGQYPLSHSNNEYINLVKMLNATQNAIAEHALNSVHNTTWRDYENSRSQDNPLKLL